MALRVLFIGFEDVPQEKDDEEFRLFKIPDAILDGFQLPTIYDYHVVFISPVTLIHIYCKFLLSQKATQVEYFLRAPFGGIIITPIVRSSQYYDWVPPGIKPDLIEADGEEVVINNDHWLAPILTKYKKEKAISWWGHAKYNITSLPKESTKNIIATNLTDNPIAWEASYGNGRVLYLPYYKFKDKQKEATFLREILDKIKSRFKILEKKQVPVWASKQEYSFDREKNIDAEIQKLNDEKQTLVKVKSILWLDGEELTEAIAFTLKQLDINCKVTEREGRHDIEMIEENLHAITEVKGLSGYVNVRDLRQLQDWYAEKLKEDENIKGIFIVNEFKEIEPEARKDKTKGILKDRDYPFTKEAERIAKNNGFCLLTTYQLFSLFKSKLEGKYNKKELLKKLKILRDF